MTKTVENCLRDGGKPGELIGMQVQYSGKRYEIIDVLQDEHAFVLSSYDNEEVQEDRYGRAHRLVPHTEIVPFCDEHGQITHACREMQVL